MFRRYTQVDLDDGTTQVNAYFFTNENDPDNMVVASVAFVKTDPLQTVDDFIATKEDDLAEREAYAATLPAPEPGDPTVLNPVLQPKDLIDLLVEKGVLKKEDVEQKADEVGTIELPPIATPIEVIP